VLSPAEKQRKVECVGDNTNTQQNFATEKFTFYILSFEFWVLSFEFWVLLYRGIVIVFHKSTIFDCDKHGAAADSLSSDSEIACEEDKIQFSYLSQRNTQGAYQKAASSWFNIINYPVLYSRFSCVCICAPLYPKRKYSLCCANRG